MTTVTTSRDIVWSIFEDLVVVIREGEPGLLTVSLSTRSAVAARQLAQPARAQLCAEATSDIRE